MSVCGTRSVLDNYALSNILYVIFLETTVKSQKVTSVEKMQETVENAVKMSF
jgi:hypothetical protein